jgi:hypothetical protein
MILIVECVMQVPFGKALGSHGGPAATLLQIKAMLGRAL